VSYCFETEGSVCELISPWVRVSGILNVCVAEKALDVDLRFENRYDVRRLFVMFGDLEARAARTSTRGANIGMWRST
jgi:hypothetical protein